ncbi:hypothetical protein LEP1GSC175_1921 [Leptospira santarosai str. HAI821]|uniref:hypothetical protein n=1 Tax=Leptospira santarosai TaxID=28183 RepID=UPI0002BD37EA|nr:hypothetical protein [Leptospira santarosai]EMO33154.1 hypothetical protein LEP1GSC175_1921 [Leptospira santarosai str. HAI821]
MQRMLIIVTVLYSISLFSADKENSWYLDTKELQCKNVIETKQATKVDLSLSGIKKSNVNCKNKNLRKLDGLEDINTIPCGDTEYFYMPSEERCNQLEQFISINAKTWYIFFYVHSNKDFVTKCLYTGDSTFEAFYPGKYVFKNGCKIKKFDRNVGILTMDCSQNAIVSITMPSLFYTNSEEMCSRVKEMFDKELE